MRCRPGWVLFDPLAADIVGGTMPIRESILSGWVQRDQQVLVAETLVTLAATIHHKSQLAHRDVIWFVDNLGALSVLIKGNSSQFDA